MTAVGEAITAAAVTLPLWRDAAITVLALIVIGCLYFYATVVGEP